MANTFDTHIYICVIVIVSAMLYARSNMQASLQFDGRSATLSCLEKTYDLSVNYVYIEGCRLLRKSRHGHDISGETYYKAGTG